MTDRDRLIELLKKQVGYTLPIFTATETIKIIADYLLANGVTLSPKWISVKDKLPDKEGKYLCCWSAVKSINVYSFAKNLQKIDKYNFKDEKREGWYDCSDEWGYYEISTVTHWMPLPELPKEREHK